MQGKSNLNANAVPYIPLSMNPSTGDNMAAKKLMGVSEKCEDVGRASGSQLADNVSPKKPHVFEKCEDVDSYENLINEESAVAENQSMPMLDYLVIMFPDYSAESLAEILKLNGDDLDDTIDMMQEFEPAGGDLGESSGTSDPAAEKSDFIGGEKSSSSS